MYSFLPYIIMNQPSIYMCLLRLKPPSCPSKLSQSTGWAPCILKQIPTGSLFYICSTHYLIWFVLSYMSSLYILDINLISDTKFTNIFSHSIDCFFTFVNLFFPLWGSPTCLVLLLLLVLMVSYPKYHCQGQRQRYFSLFLFF